MANDHQKGGVNPVSVGLAGMIIGAAAGAAAVALSDDRNRKKLQKTATQLKTEGSKRLKEWKENAEDLKETTEGKLDEAKKKLGKDTKQAES